MKQTKTNRGGLRALLRRLNPGGFHAEPRPRPPHPDDFDDPRVAAWVAEVNERMTEQP